MRKKIKPEIWVMRVGHRLVRDDRVSTHIGLVARAFGATGMYIDNGDKEIKESLDKVTRRWGGGFKIEIINGWKKILHEWSDSGKIIVHLTMYGSSINQTIDTIRSHDEDIMVIVGGEKVPRPVYDISDYNLSIGNQPHSEIAALAVFLDRFYKGEELKGMFKQSKIWIVPNSKGKTVQINNEN